MGIPDVFQSSNYKAIWTIDPITRRGLLQASPTYRNLKQGVSQMIKSVEIYFRDLTSEAQANLLEEFETKEEDENWDVFPIAVIDRELEESSR